MKTPNMRRSVVSVAASITAVTTVIGALALLAPAGAAERPSRAGPSACRGMEQLTVPGAERLEAACLADLTTAGTIKTGHTDPSSFTGFGGLSVPGTKTPSGVPGIQLDGYFPDTSTFNTTHGWNHDAQFVIRLPRHWNGGLVVAGPPSIRRQYASDVIISDYVLSRGYAYASTDKGNSGPMLYTDGQQPGDVIAEWHSRVTELTVAAKDVLAQRYHREPRRTYVAGFSAAGYLARWQLENRPDLYDGGIAWSGVLMTPERNLLTYLPTALRHYPAVRRQRVSRRHIRPSSTQASRAVPSRPGSTATARSGTTSSGSCARSSTPPTTETPLPAIPSALLGPSTATPTTTWRRARPRSDKPSRGSRSRVASGSPCCSCREPSTPLSLLVTRASTPP